MTRLAKVCQPYAIDFIWHGMSSRPAFSETPPGSKDHWLTQFTDQVLNLMDHLGIEKAVIEGESLGGWITYDMAINHPDRTSKIILNTTWGMHLDPTHVHEGESDLDALRQVSVNALLNPTTETLRKRLEWLMPLGGVTDELIDLRRALWTIPETREALLLYYDYLFRPNIGQFYACNRNIEQYLFVGATLSKMKFCKDRLRSQLTENYLNESLRSHRPGFDPLRNDFLG